MLEIGQKPRDPAVQQLRKVSNRFAHYIRLGNMPGWSETSTGQCRACTVGEDHPNHTTGVRRFRLSWWVPLNPGDERTRHLGWVSSSPEICVACALEVEKGRRERRL